MIAYGGSDKAFYCFKPGLAPGDYIVLLIELVRIRENDREKWVPQLKEQLWHAVHTIGRLQVTLPEPKVLVDFTSHPPEQVRTREIPAGPTEFELLSLDLPRKLGGRSMEIAVLPGTLYGLALGGLITAMYDYQPHWKRYHQLQVLDVLRKALRKRLVEVAAVTAQQISA